MMGPVVIKVSTDCLKKVIKEMNLLVVFHCQNKTPLKQTDDTTSIILSVVYYLVVLGVVVS